MDPISIAPIVISTWNLIAPYLKKVTGKLVDKAGESLPEIPEKIWSLLKNKLETQKETQSLPTELISNPDDQMVQGAFQYQLKKLLENDKGFARQLDRLLKEAKQNTSTIATLHGGGAIAQGSGAKAVGQGGISIEGNISGGNITIGGKNNVTKKSAKKIARQKKGK